ncbi:MAG: hypothetical protein C5B54_08105, partial [Acidobacteria bacterium]
QKAVVGGLALHTKKKIPFTINLNQVYDLEVSFNAGQFAVSIDGVSQSGLTLNAIGTPSGNVSFRVKPFAAQGTVTDIDVY